MLIKFKTEKNTRGKVFTKAYTKLVLVISSPRKVVFGVVGPRRRPHIVWHNVHVTEHG
jgi:hypothetical protein